MDVCFCESVISGPGYWILHIITQYRLQNWKGALQILLFSIIFIHKIWRLSRICESVKFTCSIVKHGINRILQDMCKICESVICGPGYCLLLPADAATVLFPLTPKNKHKNSHKLTQKKHLVHWKEHPPCIPDISQFRNIQPFKSTPKRKIVNNCPKQVKFRVFCAIKGAGLKKITPWSVVAVVTNMSYASLLSPCFPVKCLDSFPGRFLVFSVTASKGLQEPQLVIKIRSSALRRDPRGQI